MFNIQWRRTFWFHCCSVLRSSSFNHGAKGRGLVTLILFSRACSYKQLVIRLLKIRNLTSGTTIVQTGLSSRLANFLNAVRLTCFCRICVSTILTWHLFWLMFWMAMLMWSFFYLLPVFDIRITCIETQEFKQDAFSTGSYL